MSKTTDGFKKYVRIFNRLGLLAIIIGLIMLIYPEVFMFEYGISKIPAIKKAGYYIAATGGMALLLFYSRHGF